MHGEVHHLVGAVVDACMIGVLDAVAHEGDEGTVLLEGVEHREDLGILVHLVGPVADLCRPDRPPCLVAADAVDHELGDGIERELAWFRNEHICGAHEDVGAVDGREDVLVREGMDALRIAFEGCLGKGRRVREAVEVALGERREPLHLGDEAFPDVAVVADIDEEDGLMALHGRDEVGDDGGEELLLRAGATDRDEVADRSASEHAPAAACTVGFDVAHKLVVHIVAGIEERIVRHGHKLPLRIHATELVVAEIAARRLHRMDRALCQMQRHRPVVGDRVHDLPHACMHGCLRGPGVGADVGDVAVDVLEDWHAELGVLLVCRIVGELAEAFAVEGLPDEAVEGREVLRELRPKRIEAVLVLNHLRARGLAEGEEVEPVGGIAHRMGCRCHCHRDPVVPEPHADVADNDRGAVCALVGPGGLGRQGCRCGIGGEVEGLCPIGEHEAADTERLSDHGRLCAHQVVDGIRIIAEAALEALLRLDSLPVRGWILGIAERAPRAVSAFFLVPHGFLLDGMELA